MQPELLPPAAVNDHFRVVAAHEEDFNWTAMHNEHPVLQICGLRISDGSMDLVSVWSAEISPETLLYVTNLVLKEATTAATENHLGPVRFLLPDDHPSAGTSGLTENGFVPTATLQVWKTPQTSSHEPDAAIDHQLLSKGLKTHGAQSLGTLVAECLEDSHDLRSLGPPTPHCLMSAWTVFPAAEIFVARDQDQSVGLAVVTRDSDACLATLQYIGVAKRFRRQGHARRLLRQARMVEVASCTLPVVGELVAYCDRQNIPGMQLYRSGGFVQGDTHTIWLCSNDVN